jgi:type IV pilus assembly protein PilB
MKRIGDALIDAGVITEAQLKEALSVVKKKGIKLGEALIEMNIINEKDLLLSLSDQLGIPTIQDDELVIDPSLIHEVPYNLAKKYNLIPMTLQNGRLIVATSDPLNVSIIDDIESRSRKAVSLVLASSRNIAESIEQYYSGAEHIAKTFKQVHELEEENLLSKIEEEDLDLQNTPVIKFVNQILQKAVKESASDIHIEIDNINFHIRFRIDGLLQTIFRPKAHLHPLIISRLKVMSGMDVSESRVPQDGRIALKIESGAIDFRTATIPSMHGENMVVRILNRSSGYKKLSELGFSEHGLHSLENLLNKKSGMVLVAGQTGSGKTTTLYSILRELNDETRKIITLEDPVEIQLPLLNQIQINPKIDLTFASGLRSVLRMDPDIIMIGEIRDQETAKLAVNAAMTGHLVFSTLHTGSAAEIPVRLMEMGIEPYLIGNTLIGAIAQRLVRLNCPSCSEVEKIPHKMNVHANGDFESKRGRGCSACNRIGYKDRTCIEEVMPITRDIKKLILDGADSDTIHDHAVQAGMVSLFDSGFQKVRQGLISFEELARVI